MCDAIQHAHQKGILSPRTPSKPSKCGSPLYDGKPSPQGGAFCDFAVPRPPSGLLTERTLFTQYGTMGFRQLEYVSPEQAK